MANTNKFHGLARGPIDHNASSVINAVANAAVIMGSAVHNAASLSSENLPRMGGASGAGGFVYGIAVGGDADGIYGDGSGTTDGFQATSAAGQGIVIVTQGRCLARVTGTATVAIGDPLTLSATMGVLDKAVTEGDLVCARALQAVTSGDTDMIAIDFQREGTLSVP